MFSVLLYHKFAQSAGVVEYTDPPHNECPGYDTKQSDGEVPVMYLHLNCVLILNWIIWNGTFFDIECVLTLN